ncbi:tRNA pseudouridine(38-40) synthase TruA [Leeuwenhoekiella polynyae]|uniref:tRNA pseudouridine synthase A n=1 Tax=Leeuwenhoekiella polynyae TaxID=1550906 RepID=A0A4Q0PBI5_9FLAO|nr:tRNA pseudouridine(38-40) synthase TruA [Leeuwenhoekiella polynyae]RXG24087.1 tRNA pseudouridine(38-40) synthase [Leeuwenhoekiella polynyae]
MQLQSQTERLRYFIDIAYDGGPYHGWQRQPQSITVQEVLEGALSTLLRKEMSVVGAGRTDAGVHATQLYVHFDYEAAWTPKEIKHLQFRLNRFLPEAIAVNSILRVVEEAHARFDATRRSYVYKVHTFKTPFMVNQSYFFEKELDLNKMNEAAQFLLGKQDFKCFSRSNTDVKTYLCEIVEAQWIKQENSLLFKISADRFLRNMVRAVVGTLLEVGLGKLDPQDLKTIIASRTRSEAGASAPAHGLYLTEVRYPEEIFLPYGK